MITMQYGRGSDSAGGGSAPSVVDYTSQIVVSKGTMLDGSSLRRYGNVVVLNYYGGSVSVTSTASQLLTIPAELAPSATVYAIGSSGWANMSINLTTAGAVMIATQSSSSGNCRVNLVWVL